MDDLIKQKSLADELARKFAESAQVIDKGTVIKVEGTDFSVKPKNPFKRDQVKVKAELDQGLLSYFRPPRWKITVKSGQWLSGRHLTRTRLVQEFENETSIENQRAAVLEKISRIGADEQIVILSANNESDEAITELIARDL